MPVLGPELNVRYDTALAHARADDLSPELALEELGALIDLAGDLRRPDGVRVALEWAGRLHDRPLDSARSALLHYFEANAWEISRTFSRKGEDLWSWPQPELEKQIVHLRWALKHGANADLPTYRLCQVLTNLGNLLSHCGRIVDALAYWDRAIEIDGRAGMPRGNRTLGLEQYVRLVHDRGHKALLLREAYAEVKRALDLPLEGNAKSVFASAKARMEANVPKGFFDAPPLKWQDTKRRSKQEVAYRSWCLKERLFLNDLNDLGSLPVAAADVLTLPGIVVPLGEGPSLLGFFNQMKQEFVSARYLLYEGVHGARPHFSDRDVLLVNTLDYPAYSLATEKEKVAFRVAYSLLDKVAFFLNQYLELGIPDEQVFFRRIWTEGNGSTRTLRSTLHRPRNMPLQALFWLSKDLYEREPGFTEAIEPDAQEIAAIRNHLEHKYLKLHSPEWSGPVDPTDEITRGLADTLAHSLRLGDFEAKVLRVLRMARAALVYLSLTVYVEEAERAARRQGPGVVMPMELDRWEDDWKF